MSIVNCAINYYEDFVKPNKNFREATEQEREAFLMLADKLKNLASDSAAEEIQSVVYAIGKESEFELSNWFKALYEVLLGASRGPRFGSFISLYGIDETIKLIEEKV